MLGRFLFHWRAYFAVAGFVLVFALGQPTRGTWVSGLPLLLLGLGLRVWAMGHVGVAARSNDVGGDVMIQSGPYRWFRHPLYLGNFMLVAGILLQFRPPVWFGAVVAGGYLVLYTLMAKAEEKHLADVVREERRFSWQRAGNERWTWIVTLAATGLCLLRAVLR
ncbi:MAG: methyltransferase [candidate division WOR-3 bacterium]